MPFDLNSNPVRIAIGVALLVVGLLAGWFLHKSVSAQPDIAMIGVYDDWRISCLKPSDKDGGCELSLDIQDEKKTTVLARLQIFKAKKEGQMMIMTVPYDLALEPGVALAFGNDKPRAYPYEFCGNGGCIVRAKFDDDVAKAMQKATQARILVAQLNGKIAALPFSLKGYAAAHNAYMSDDAKRHSWWRRLWS